MGGSITDFLRELPEWTTIVLSVAFALVILVVVALILLLRVLIHELLIRTDEPDNNFYVDAAYFHEIGQRSRQEDALFVSPLENYNKHGLIALVTDGMGGMTHGDFVSGFVVNEFSKIPLDDYDHREYIVKKIREVSNRIYQKYNREAGATLVLVRVDNNMLDLYSVGDSDVILIRNGKSIVLNHKQNYGSILVSNLAKSGKVTREAYLLPESRQLVDFIGNNNPNVIFTRQSLRLQDNDVILIASDGVLDTLSVEALPEYVNGDASKSASRIKSEIKQQKVHSQDNYTCIILKLRHKMF